MTPKERDYIAGLCATHAGLNIDTERAYLIESRMAAVARREGFGSVEELVRAVRDRGEEQVIWTVVEALAPAQTAFFREPAVFEALLRELQEGVELGASLRVWSAACGTGQEIYSLAMLLEERGVEGIELFASDLNGRMIEKGKAGIYNQFEVQQGLSARRLVRHFDNHEEAFIVSADLRRAVRWRRHNLIETPNGMGSFDVILCRNVLGALLPAARDKVLAHLAGALRIGGRLVLGAAETVTPKSGLVAVAGEPGVFELPAAVRVAA
ncbi:CheR family methyltransferase [Phenylobacterium soli]|uniref:Chemotaxis protein CheR n=1 Tax=Phenylobacterium soli TaxID=2170551 RepID=A0A328AGL5_9CAUL|nr:protein-glutamate O-methyltransferase CheR [Phenylobacterium soli]RAK53256.1 chemotaxis protein CheR [Phenylobacterium soli]